MKSGSMPANSVANRRPVRPIPAITSSNEQHAVAVRRARAARAGSRPAGRRRRSPSPSGRRRSRRRLGALGDDRRLDRGDRGDVARGLAEALVVRLRHRHRPPPRHAAVVDVVGGGEVAPVEPHRAEGDAMEGALPREDLLAVGLATQVVVLTRQLDRDLVGLGAAGGEVRVAHAGRQARQALGQLDLGGRGEAEDVKEGQLSQLARSPRSPPVTIPQNGCLQCRDAVEVLLAVRVPQAAALPGLSTRISSKPAPCDPGEE